MRCTLHRVVHTPCCTCPMLCTHCAAHDTSATCTAAPACCPASTQRVSYPLWAFVEEGLAKTQCEKHRQHLRRMQTSCRRVSVTAEGRAVFYNDYVEMEITMRLNNSSGICDANERDNLLPGLIQISKHIFRWENSRNIPPGRRTMTEGKSKAISLTRYQTAGRRLISVKPCRLKHSRREGALHWE